MLPYLNLGCGKRYHTDWVNVDMVSDTPHVRAHNLLSGIPYPNETFEAVYHSHVLEHFPKPEGEAFLHECVRVLKKSGTLRIAVPDLEGIVRQYLHFLDKSLVDISPESGTAYDWMMLELYDQTVRQQPGGEMLRYLKQNPLPMKDFVLSRIGSEGEQILQYLQNPETGTSTYRWKKFRSLSFLGKWQVIKGAILGKLLWGKTRKVHEIGSFRLSGEVHQWMYDRYSLGRLLTQLGLTQVRVMNAFESRIPDWKRFELDGKEGRVFKPDSLFIEGIRPE